MFLLLILGMVTLLAFALHAPTTGLILVFLQLAALPAAAKGLTNKAIAAELELEEGSVGRMVSEIYCRLGLESRTGLAGWYRAHPVMRLRIWRRRL
jgi:hypothetical protein